MKFLTTTIVAIFVSLLFGWATSNRAEAANRYWVGTGSGWSSALNWSASDPSSCSPGGATVPGTGDVAIFDADCDGDADIDTNVGVAGIDMKSGYTGTLNQSGADTVTVGSSNFTQAGGTFTGGSEAIDINGNVSLSGGTFTNTSGSLTVSGNWAKTGGTFTSGGATTVTFDGSGTQTINSGGTDTGSDFQNLTKSNSGTLQLTTNALDIDGTLTISSSTTVDLNGQNIRAVTLDNSGTLLLEGGETVTNTTFDTDSGTVTYDGTSSYTGLAAGDAYYALTFNGSGGAWTLDAALDVNNTLTISAGTLDASTSNYGVTLAGDWSNSGSFTERSGTVTFDGSGAQALNGETFYNLTINNSAGSPGDATDVDSSAAVTVTNTLTVTDGQFQPTTASDFSAVTISTNGILKPDSSASIAVSGNWNNTGTFTANSGTVTFDGTSQALNDDNTFYNLTKTVTSADTLTLEASTTQTISNTLTLDGTSSATLSLRSSASGTRFTLAPASATTVTYLDVKDSQASTSNITCSTGCTNSGGNDDGEAEPRWVFSSSNTAPTASVPRSITQINDTIEFKTDINDTNGDKSQLLVEYSTDQSNWKKATISKAVTSQGDITITQSATYPIASIDTDNGKIILTVTWNAKDNFASSEEDKLYLRLTPYDGTDVGSTVISDSFALDTRAPVVSNIYLKARTSTSLTPSWTPDSEKNFDKYVLCYGTDLTKVKNCTLTGKNAAKQWTTAQDSKLSTFTTSQTTITGLAKNKTYHILLKATDKFSHTSTLLLQSVKTSNAPAPPHLTVTGVQGATIDLSWTETGSALFIQYDLCYGQNQGRVTGSSCRATGNPAGAVLKSFTPKTNTKTTLTGLKESRVYYAKIWVRDWTYGLIAGNSVSAITCKAGETKVAGVCTAPPPPPPPPICSDGLDNDGDGVVDFPADPGCGSASDTNEADPVPSPETTPTPSEVPPPEALPTPPLEPEPTFPPIIENISEAVSNAVEAFLAFIENTFGETVAEVAKKIVQVVATVVKTTARVVVAVVQVVPTQPAVVVPVAVATAVAVAASTGLVTVVPNFAGELFYLGQRLMQGLLGLAGARRRYPWGRVVDAQTGTPLPQTIIRILDRQSQRLRDTAITDAKGDFTSLLSAGQYRFEAIKPGWHLDPSPARFLNILQNQQIYDGNFVDVRKEGVVSIIIAMRTEARQEVSHIALRVILQRIEKFLTALSWPLLIFGSTLSVLALVKAQTALNIGIAILYVVLIGAKVYVQRNRQETTGHVKDTATNSPLKEALVQLYNAETGRLMATKVTSESGRFALVPPPGVYTVIVSKSGYTTYRESHVVIEPKKRAALSMTFVLTPEAPQTLQLEGLPI